jgi:hypothetical protein
VPSLWGGYVQFNPPSSRGAFRLYRPAPGLCRLPVACNVYRSDAANEFAGLTLTGVVFCGCSLTLADTREPVSTCAFRRSAKAREGIKLDWGLRSLPQHRPPCHLRIAELFV